MRRIYCFLFLSFIAGFFCGSWDAKHGYETGLKAGKAVRALLLENKNG